MRVWERLFTYSFVAAGFSWGVGGWLLLPEAFAYRAMIFFFLVGMASAAVAVYSIHVWAVMFTILALVLPTTLDFALQDSLQERLMALAVVLFVIAAFRSLRITHHFVQRAHSLSYDLQGAKEQAETLARTDFLTGMNNRRSFYDLCETPFKLARRYGQDLAAILFDIDQFKAINDTHGHAVGDEVLKNLSRIVAKTCRDSDVAGRVGGEEFAILLPHTNAQNAQELAERLREQMEQSVVDLDRGDVKFTASFGVAQMSPECESLEALVAMADGAMYQAKQRGKNCVFVVAPPAPENAPLGPMEADDAPRGVRRRIIHLFVLSILFILATSATPTLHSSQDVLREWLDPLVDGVGLWQGQWALFGPEADKINMAVVGLVEFADGERAEWRHPNWHQLSPREKFRFFRFMEFTDGIWRNSNQGAWPAFAEYVVRVRPHPTDPSVRVTRVSLWRQSVVIPPPRVPLRPIADPFPLSENQLFYSRVYGP